MLALTVAATLSLAGGLGCGLPTSDELWSPPDADAQELDSEGNELAAGELAPFEEALRASDNTPSRKELHARIVGEHVSVGYRRARALLFAREGGVYDAAGDSECVYTGRHSQLDDSPTPPGFSVEHAWPQSLGARSEPMRSDLHHLFPAELGANSRRGNRPFALARCLHGVAEPCVWEEAGSALGGRLGGTDTVFEVRHDRRGDIARALFYFAVRYDRSIRKEDEAELRRWHVEDPPDDGERRRNERIEAQQHNRNLFVDSPEYVELISDF